MVLSVFNGPWGSWGTRRFPPEEISFGLAQQQERLGWKRAALHQLALLRRVLWPLEQVLPGQVPLELASQELERGELLLLASGLHFASPSLGLRQRLSLRQRVGLLERQLLGQERLKVSFGFQFFRCWLWPSGWKAGE